MIINPNYNLPSATGQRGIIEINAFVVAGSGKGTDSIQKSQLPICMHIAAMHTTPPTFHYRSDEKGKQERPQEVNKNDGRRRTPGAVCLLSHQLMCRHLSSLQTIQALRYLSCLCTSSSYVIEYYRSIEQNPCEMLASELTTRSCSCQ